MYFYGVNWLFEQNNSRRGQKKNFRASREILPTLAKILCTRLLGWEGDLELRGFGLMKGKVVERDGVGRWEGELEESQQGEGNVELSYKYFLIVSI